MRTLNAPKGVTSIAGAKAYAAKFEISPSPTVISQRKASNILASQLTTKHSHPPERHFQVRESFALKAMFVSCIVQALLRDSQPEKLISA
jgi:hypothetical protein